MRRLQYRTLYVGGLSEDTDDDALRELFAACTGVKAARVVTFPSGRCRGFGYVTFDDDHAATAAIERLDGSAHGDVRLRVAPAT